MRVISGSARGKQLLSVPGMTTRPTTDRVKESIFNILQFSVQDARVLDLFAGTGQMGIEALSRGAREAVFVDADQTAAAVVRKNIEGARVQDKSTVFSHDFHQCLPQFRGKPFDIIFLDPPYGGKILNDALNQIELFDICSSGGIIICESSWEDEVICPKCYVPGREYRYGSIKVTLIRNSRE